VYLCADCPCSAATASLYGNWLRAAALSIRDVATTEGNDITHLMQAMNELRRVFRLQRITILVSLGLVATALLVSTGFGASP